MKTGRLINSLFLWCFLWLFAHTVFSQKFKPGIHFHAFADNREYQYEYQYPQTIFGFRVTPYISTTVDSVHHFRAGVNTLYEFGGSIGSKNFIPEVYYNYRGKSLDLKFGSFPRREDFSDYSLLLLTDTLFYFRPTVQGLMAKAKKGKLNARFWIDWVSRQTARNKEQFLFGLVAKYKTGPFFVEDQFSMLHDAFAAIRQPDDVLHDNGANILKGGLEWEGEGMFDRLLVAFGMASGYERARALNQLRTPSGFLQELVYEKKWFVFRNTFFAGQSFNQVFGDRFYRARRYNRTDLRIRFFRKSKVSCLFTYSIHRVDGQWDNQQALQLFAEF